MPTVCHGQKIIWSLSSKPAPIGFHLSSLPTVFKGRVMKGFLALLKLVGWRTVNLSAQAPQESESRTGEPAYLRDSDSPEPPAPHVSPHQPLETAASV